MKKICFFIKKAVSLQPNFEIMNIPAHIQTMIDKGFAYEDLDGSVRLYPIYCGNSFNIPNIEIHNHYHYHYYSNNVFDSHVQIGQIIE